MQSISYVRAGVSCLPLVGPLVGAFNAAELERDLSWNAVTDTVLQTRIGVILLQANVMQLAGGNVENEQVQRDVEGWEAIRRNGYSLDCQKARIYTICGIVGDVLSIAIVVGLIASGILGAVGGFIAAAPYAFQAADLGCDLYLRSKTIRAPQALNFDPNRVMRAPQALNLRRNLVDL